MQHLESSVVVFSTTEYARFNMINGNRQLNEKKIARIIEEIQSGNDMLRYYPIQVRENKQRLDILDGQHRMYICKKLRRPVYYILVTENKSMPDIAKINSNVERWKNEDYINCYVQHGNKNYEQLRDFLDQYRFSLSVALLLLSTGSPGSEAGQPRLVDNFRNGQFISSHLDAAEELAKECKRFEAFGNWKSRSFVIAIYKIMKADLISIDEVLAAYNKRPEMLTEQLNYKAYINTLEQIVNVGKHKRTVIV